MPRTRSSRVQGRGRCNAVRHRRRPYEARQRGRPAVQSWLALAIEPRSLAARMQPDPIRATGPIPLTGCAKCATMVTPMPTAAVGTRLSQEEVGDGRKVVGRLGGPPHGCQVRYIRYIRYDISRATSRY